MNKKGPTNTSRVHFTNPVPIQGQDRSRRWEMKCKHCSRCEFFIGYLGSPSLTFQSCFSFKRTVDKEKSFEDELVQPPLGNLATHLRIKHPNASAPTDSPPPGLTHGISASSSKIMDDFLREGQLNPAIKPTQKGFYKVFAAWVLEDDLPFTTGETGGIHRLFSYMQSKFMLPSDTTVRSTLARIFIEMFEVVQAELKVIFHPVFYYLVLIHTQL